MKYRVLGNTGMKVSVIGIGGIPIQQGTVADAEEILKTAVEQGVNFLDTARGYTTSEKTFGEALKNFDRGDFYIATKSMKRDYDSIKQEFETSMSNLGIDYLDLFQFHNISKIEDYKRIQEFDGAFKFVTEMIDAGRIKHVGVTSHNADMLKTMVESGLFETIQFPYNAVENQAEPVFELAHKMGIGVILMKPLAGGALTNAKLALRYALSNDDVTVAIPGIANAKQLLENVQAVEGDLKLNDEEFARLSSEAKSLGTDFCRRCGYCAPCTVGIDIPFQFLLEGYYTRYDLKEWAMERYSGLSKNAGDCIECGACEPRCPYDLKIIDKLKRVNETMKQKEGI